MHRLPLSHWSFESTPQGITLHGHSIKQVARELGTPFYLLDELRLRQNARAAQQTIARHFRSAGLFYSFKTNSHPRVVDGVRSQSIGAEVISVRELSHAVRAGFSGERIIFNGPGKSASDLAAGIDRGALIQVESIEEAADLVALSAQRERRVRAGIRVCPNIFDDRTHTTLHMGSAQTVFGIPPGSDLFADTARLLDQAPLVDLVSLSAHIGTGIIRVDPYGALLELLLDLRKSLVQQGIGISTLNLGGGYAVSSEVRYPTDIFDDSRRNADHLLPAPNEIATFEEICSHLARRLPADDELSVFMEPGRLLVSDACHLITRVVRTKQQGDSKYAILDASRFQNAMFVGRGFHQIVNLSKPDDPPDGPWNIVGPLCAGFDGYAHSRTMPRFEVGDVVMILDVGAYNLQAQSDWSFAPAPLVSVRTDRSLVEEPH